MITTCHGKKPKAALRGFSLLEISITLLFLSIALVPVVQFLGNHSVGGAANGESMTQASRQNSRVSSAANALAERALAGDPNHGINTLPGLGGVLTTNRRQFTDDYNQNVWYRWVLRDVTRLDDGSSVAGGNRLVQATLQVYESATATNPEMNIPLYIYRQPSSVEENPIPRVGILVVQDMSGSMTMAGEDEYPPVIKAHNGSRGVVLASPYLRYRFDAATVPANLRLDLFDDKQFDSVAVAYSRRNASGQAPDPNPDTPFYENYPQRNIQIPNGSNPPINLFPNVQCDEDTNWEAAGAPLTQLFLPEIFRAPHDTVIPGQAHYPEEYQNTVAALCGDKDDEDESEAQVNNYLSRIEASRTALFSFIHKLEQSTSVLDQADIGLMRFSAAPGGTGGGGPTAASLVSALERSQTMGSRRHFVNFRRHVSWMNRFDPNNPSNANPFVIWDDAKRTRIYDGINEGAKYLFGRSDLGERIMVFVTDGEPDPATDTNTYENIVDLARQVGNASHPNANGKTITMYTVGLIDADQGFMDEIASQTPGGSSFFAQSVTDFTPIFDSIAYQIQKAIIFNYANRYNLNI
jgi:hypothetical protein